MTSISLNATGATVASSNALAPSMSVLSLIAAFFTLSLREKLDPSYTGENEDAAYYGCGM